MLEPTCISPCQLCGSERVCDYSLQGFFAQAYGVCVAYVATLKKTHKMGLSLYVCHHHKCVGLNVCVCVTTACKDLLHTYGVCVLPMWPHLRKHKMGLSLHASRHDICVGLNVCVTTACKDLLAHLWCVCCLCGHT